MLFLRYIIYERPPYWHDCCGLDKVCTSTLPEAWAHKQSVALPSGAATRHYDECMRPTTSHCTLWSFPVPLSPRMPYANGDRHSDPLTHYSSHATLVRFIVDLLYSLL